jgi:uncharacterized membrane protein YhaH (DUF805 family)
MTTRYWFPAKRNGWGWGLPLTWQGWAVLAAFIALIVANGRVFPPNKALLAYIVGIVGLSVLFVAVCWLKGEPPRWRWGEDDQPKP